MFCTKCSAEMREGDIFCPKCGAPQKIRDSSVLDEDLIRKTAASVDVTPENDEVPPEEREFIGQHRKNSSEIEQEYSMYYDSMEKTKRKKVGGCFLRFVLIIFFAVLIIAILLSGVLLIRGENPIEYGKSFISSIISDKNDDVSESDIVTESDIEYVTLTDTTAEITSTSTTTTTTTSSNTMFTTKKTTSTTKKTTKKTTTTTKPTTKNPLGQQIRDTSVGKWKADVSALGLKVAGSKIKTINISIDKNGKADVDFKLGIIKVKTSGSFTVEDDGRTDLTIKVPMSSDVINVVGYSKVVNKDQIVFLCSEGEITLNRK